MSFKVLYLRDAGIRGMSRSTKSTSFPDPLKGRLRKTPRVGHGILKRSSRRHGSGDGPRNGEERHARQQISSDLGSKEGSYDEKGCWSSGGDFVLRRSLELSVYHTLHLQKETVPIGESQLAEGARETKCRTIRPGSSLTRADPSVADPSISRPSATVLGQIRKVARP